MKRLARSTLLPALAYFVLLEILLAAALLYWPNFEENVGALKAMAPIDVLKDMVDSLAQGGIEAYVVGQHFFKGCNTLGTAAAVLFAAGAVAGEVQRGTLELWLARPITRKRLLLRRWIAGALALCVPIMLTSLSIPWLLGFVDAEVSLPAIMLCAVHQSVFLLTIYSLTFLLSTLFDSPMGIALCVLFLATMHFALYMVKVVTHWSLYRWADIEVFMKIFERERLDWNLMGLLLGTSALFLGLALYSFSRKLP